MKLQIGFVILLATTAPSFAAPPPNVSSGNGLYEVCSTGAPRQTMAQLDAWSECFTYVSAISDFGGMTRRFCYPEGVTKGQIVDVAVARLHNKPSERHLPSAYLVATALQESFPCATK